MDVLLQKFLENEVVFFVLQGMLINYYLKMEMFLQRNLIDFQHDEQ